MMKNEGFTLLEVLFVLMISSTLMLIAGISGKAWMDRYRVEGQMREIYTDLLNARINAMQKNRIYFVTLSSTQYAIYEDRDAANPTNPSLDGDGAFQQATDLLVLRKNLNVSYSLTIPPEVARIDFDSRGQVSATPGPMGTQKTIRVTASFGAAYDCITISTMRIKMGVYDYDGATCFVQ
jgi:prepilin-type N-terminal cleavage/methylation domain-containing protein